jgi:hypothetical protein
MDFRAQAYYNLVNGTPDHQRNGASNLHAAASEVAEHDKRDGHFLHGYGAQAALSEAGYIEDALSMYRTQSIAQERPAGVHTLYQQPARRAGGDGDWLSTIYVKNNSNGKTITLSVEYSDTIETVKQKIEDKEGISAYNQRLITAGKVLQDNQTLGDIGVGNESTIFLITKGAGGCGTPKKYTKRRRGNRRRALITHKTSMLKSKSKSKSKSNRNKNRK